MIYISNVENYYTYFSTSSAALKTSFNNACNLDINDCDYLNECTVSTQTTDIDEDGINDKLTLNIEINKKSKIINDPYDIYKSSITKT